MRHNHQKQISETCKSLFTLAIGTSDEKYLSDAVRHCEDANNLSKAVKPASAATPTRLR